MTSFDRELGKQLKEARNRLLNPPSSIDDLLTLLDEVENLLAYVEQASSKSMRGALLPSVKALINLINNKLLRHYEVDVKILVVSSLQENSLLARLKYPHKNSNIVAKGY